MSETPRTNFVAHESRDPEWNRSMNRFGRMKAHAEILERELAAAQAELAAAQAELKRVIEVCKTLNQDRNTFFDQSCANLERAERAEAAAQEWPPITPEETARGIAAAQEVRK